MAAASQAVEPLTTMIRAFSDRYPGVTVAIRAAFIPRDVVDMVRTGAAELGLLATPDALPDKEVTARPVGEQRFVLVTTRDGGLPAGRAVERADLAGHRVIVGQRGTGMCAYVDGLRESGIAFTVAAETEHWATILPLVLAGVGSAVLTESWRTLAEQASARALDIELKTTLKIAMVSRRGELSPAARAFLNTLDKRNLQGTSQSRRPGPAALRGDHRPAHPSPATSSRSAHSLTGSPTPAAPAQADTAGVEFLTQPRTEPYGRVVVFRDIAGDRWDLLGPAHTS